MPNCPKRPFTRPFSFTKKPVNAIQADLFCRVIDNLGDIGVMWRLAKQLTHEKHWKIRLWVDDLVTFKRLLPTLDPRQNTQQHESIAVHQWTAHWNADIAPYPVVIAGFSCDLPEPFITRLAPFKQTFWLQLEYLSAEPWVGDFHGLASLRSDGLAPIFFFPGFEPNTGGLLREDGLIEQRQRWRANPEAARQWLQSLGVSVASTQPNHFRLVSLFCYSEAPIAALHQALQTWDAPTKVLVPAGQPIPHQLTERIDDKVTWHSIPFLSQTDYDRLLWTMDLNFVRGEDSFIRGIWAGRPLIWQPYSQSEHTHRTKLNAWLTKANLPSQVQMAMQQWLQGGNAVQFESALTHALKSDIWAQWEASSAQHCHALIEQIDLASQIDQYCRQI